MRDKWIHDYINHTNQKHQLQTIFLWPAPTTWLISGSNGILATLKTLCAILVVETLTACLVKHKEPGISSRNL
jgi:hypothetical protein